MRVGSRCKEKYDDEKSHHDGQHRENDSGLPVLMVVDFHHDEHYCETDRRENQLLEREVIGIAELFLSNDG